MKDIKEDELDKQALADRWGVTIREVERRVRRFNLIPSDFFGRQPAFKLADVEAMEKRRYKARLAMREKISTRYAVLTVKQAKKMARNRGGK